MKIERIKKGRDIFIPGVAQHTVCDLTDEAADFAVTPTEYVGVVPRLLVYEGDVVEAGAPLFEDKNNPDARFVSPVSGTVKTILRGEKRALKAVVISSDKAQRCIEFPIIDPKESNADNLREMLIQSGLWTLIKQRPFGVVPTKNSKPKALFISAFDSSPLPVDMDLILKDRFDDFQYGVDVLYQIVGNIHISLNSKRQQDSMLAKTTNAKIHFFDGPHPAGLVGTHIAAIDPINKGETVWTINPQDVATIGHLFRTGHYRPERTIAMCGPSVENPQYFKTLAGIAVQSLVNKIQLNTEQEKQRLICGDVLSGYSIASDGFVGISCDKISVLPEGDYYDFMGWLRPNFSKFSFSRTFLSGLLKKSQLSILNYQLKFDTNRHGSLRPLFVTGEFEKLTPLDIYPMQLIKACIIGDIELMENLGIYEVEPEDLALCEFADTSKTEIQAIIRAGLEKIRREG